MLRDTAVTPLTVYSVPSRHGTRTQVADLDRSVDFANLSLKPLLEHDDLYYGLRDMATAVHAYDERGVAPNFDVLADLWREVSDLRAMFVKAPEELRRRDLVIASESVFRVAQQKVPAVDIAGKTAPQSLLAHLEKTLARYAKACGNREQELESFPDLYVALQAYFALLEHHAHKPPAYSGRDEIHEGVRDTLASSHRHSIIRQFAMRAVNDRASGNTLYPQLGIPKDYRSTPEDQAAFRKLFLSGQLIRTKMVYAPPKECEYLYELYGQQIDAAMGRRSSAYRMDMIAVRTYSVSSNELNQVLRENDTEKIRKFAPYIKLVISGLNRLNVYSTSRNGNGAKAAVIFRGVRLSVEELLKNGYVKGNAIDMKFFMSCSHNNRTTYCTQPEFNVKMRIRARTGKQLGSLSLYDHMEDEVLFPPWKRFRIVDLQYGQGVEKDYPRVQIEMEEIDDDQIEAFPEERKQGEAARHPQLREFLDTRFIASQGSPSMR